MKYNSKRRKYFFNILKEKYLNNLRKGQKEVYNIIKEQKYDYIWFYGGLGGGKTYLSNIILIYYSLGINGFRSGIVRTTKELVQKSLEKIVKILEEMGMINGIDFKYIKTKLKIIFANGSEIIGFGGQRASNFRSEEFGIIFFEEGNTIDFRIFRQAVERTRMKIERNGKIIFKKPFIIFTNNSDSVDEYVRFFKKQIEKGKCKEIKISTDDNKKLEEYKEKLKDMYDENEYKKMIEGEYNEDEGLFFPDFKKYENELLIDTNKIKNKIIDFYLGYDFSPSAIENKNAFILVGIDKEGKIYVIDEELFNLKNGLITIYKKYKEILERNGINNDIIIIADPAIFYRNMVSLERGGISVYNQLEELGLTIYKGNNKNDLFQTTFRSYYKTKNIFFDIYKTTKLRQEIKEWYKERDSKNLEFKDKPGNKVIDDELTAFKYVFNYISNSNIKILLNNNDNNNIEYIGELNNIEFNTAEIFN